MSQDSRDRDREIVIISSLGSVDGFYANEHKTVTLDAVRGTGEWRLRDSLQRKMLNERISPLAKRTVVDKTRDEEEEEYVKLKSNLNETRRDLPSSVVLRCYHSSSLCSTFRCSISTIDL